MTETEIDASFDLPYTRMPHPKYKGKTIPAYEMIKFSVNLHRGASADVHSAPFRHIRANSLLRSKESILKEVKQIINMPDFKGYLSDLEALGKHVPNARVNEELCRKCKRPSCLAPQICPNLNADHSSLLDIYQAVDAYRHKKIVYQQRSTVRPFAPPPQR